jgi:hypothetical protein
MIWKIQDFAEVGKGVWQFIFREAILEKKRFKEMELESFLYFKNTHQKEPIFL